MEKSSQRLLALFNIHPGEDRLVGLVLLYAILLYTANVLARHLRNSERDIMEIEGNQVTG